jgi:copper binding plastocyanin/azurin family protein
MQPSMLSMFQSQTVVSPEGAEIFVRSAGSGPVVVLLHGYPETSDKSTSDSIHSGFLQATPQDRVGLAQAPSGVARFRVTFSKPGTYPYICALHDGLGMKGKVIVLPKTED